MQTIYGSNTKIYMNTQETRVNQYEQQTKRNDLKGHANRIIQGIKKIGPNHAKRAIWELFQNAVDLSPSCEIEIRITNDEFIFSHNGVPFTMYTLDCLFTQVSSKTLTEKKLNREASDSIGEYGTGFMTSHSFGDVVKISGAIKDESEEAAASINVGAHIEFENLVVDRSTQDWEKLCDEISSLRTQVKELLRADLTDGEFPSTVFRFGFGNALNRQRALDAIESLKIILPYVMVFNDRLKKVTVTDIEGRRTVYKKQETEEDLDHYFSRIIYIDNVAQKINYLKSGRLMIILPFTGLVNENGCWGKAAVLPDSLPRLFLFYPLIGTENLGFNFVIHSKNFQPTEPRDGLHLNSENEKNKIEEEANQGLMAEASKLIFSFLEHHLSRIENPHFFAEINFVVNSDDQKLNDYFKGLKEQWVETLKALPLVETLSGTIAVKDAVFLDSMILDEAGAETLEAIYSIAGRFFPNLPKPDLIPIWTALVDEWDTPEINKISFADIAEEIQEVGHIGSFKKKELIFLYQEMIAKGEGELFANKALLPNIKGKFRKQVELSKSVSLIDELIEIADVINPKISNRQIDSEFQLEGLEFEEFGRKQYMELINVSLDEHIKEPTRSDELPEKFLFSLMCYASIVPKKDSVSGPVRVIKLIAEHYNFPFNPLVLPTLSDDDNIDVRKGQFAFFKVYLNDISAKDVDWVETNIDSYTKVLVEAFRSTDVRKFFLKYDVYPSQGFQLKPITSLKKEQDIPSFVKELYDKVVNEEEPVKSKLAHWAIQDLYDEMQSIKGVNLTREIEHRFFGESGNEIQMEEHRFKEEIIDIIKNFKEEEGESETYKKLFSATHRNKSTILVQLADGEASFKILSQKTEVIKKLAEIADHPNLDELLEQGKAALRKRKQDEALMQYKKNLGNYLEDVLKEYLDQNISAKVVNEQNGQDFIIYLDEQPVYYIEVKSKWLDTTPIRMSRNQTLRAFQKSDSFALCSINMTNYLGEDKYDVENIDKIVEYMKFNMDVGKKVGHLVAIYEDAHQKDQFSLDGDYRTLIPAKYIEEGKSLAEFVEYLKEIIANTVRK